MTVIVPYFGFNIGLERISDYFSGTTIREICRDDVTKTAADAFRLKVIASKETGSTPPIKLVSVFAVQVWQPTLPS